MLSGRDAGFEIFVFAYFYSGHGRIFHFTKSRTGYPLPFGTRRLLPRVSTAVKSLNFGRVRFPIPGNPFGTLLRVHRVEVFPIVEPDPFSHGSEFFRSRFVSFSDSHSSIEKDFRFRNGYSVLKAFRLFRA